MAVGLITLAGSYFKCILVPGSFAALLKTDLKTGNYPGKGLGSHKEMNHDVGAGSNYTWLVPETRGKQVTYESKAAEAVATKASKAYLKELKTEIDKK